MNEDPDQTVGAGPLPESVNHRRHLALLLFFAGFGLPVVILRLTGAHLDPPIAAVIFGLGIVGAAFIISWAAEAAQMDVSASLAIAVLALIAVLPEYAIEAVLAWKAGATFDPALGEQLSVTRERMDLVAANVTGANRLLIGLGWSLVFLIFWLKRRRTLDIRGYMGLEIRMLLAATAMTFIIFFMDEVHVVVAAILIGMYLLYLWITSRQPSEEPELMGPSLMIGRLPTRQRRATVVALFLFSAAIIVAAAEPFVEALVETGKEASIDEFILIQWVAPLASESPEIIVAVLFSLRANPLTGITTLVSAEVNQMTLLTGSMVAIFSLSAGQLLDFVLSARQATEFLLTASVSLFAIMLIAPRRMSWWAGAVLLGLFIAHLPFVDPDQRIIFVWIYLGLTVGLVILAPNRLKQLFKSDV